MLGISCLVEELFSKNNSVLGHKLHNIRKDPKNKWIEIWVDLSHAGCGIVEKNKMICGLLKQE